jgi:hypothetical protein
MAGGHEVDLSGLGQDRSPAVVSILINVRALAKCGEFLD